VVDLSKYQGGGASNLIPVVPTEGSTIVTVQGSVFYENDLTNLTPEKAPKGTKVSAIVDLDETPMFDKVRDSSSGAPLRSIAYNGMSLETTIDSLGKYKINLPATADGLAFKLHVADFVTTQKMLSVGATDVSITSVTKLFGSSLFDVDVYPKIDDIDVTVSNTKVTFSEPVSTPCKATVKISTDLKIKDNVVVLSGGAGYDNGFYEIQMKKADGTLGDAYADVSVVNGSVSNIKIFQQGTGFTVNKDFDVDLIQQQIVGTFARYESSVTSFWEGTSSYKYIYSFNISNKGGFLTKNNIEIVLMDGTTEITSSDYKWIYSIGMETNAANVSQYQLQNVTRTYDGSSLTGVFLLTNNYSVGTNYKLVARLKSGTSAAHYQYNVTSGSIAYVAVDDPGSGYTDGISTVIFEDSKGTGAEAIANIEGGKVMSIKVTKGGFDYTSTTKCNVYNNLVVSRATGVATVNAFGKIDKVILTSSGSGYSMPPTITFTSLYGLGVGASASAVMNGGQVNYVVVKDGGSGYQKGNFTEMSSRPSNPKVNVKTTGVTNFDIYLGTGLKIK